MYLYNLIVILFYLGITTVEKADADGILGAINKVLELLGLSDYSKKLVGFGSDGASVNTGKIYYNLFTRQQFTYIILLYAVYFPLLIEWQ